MDVVHPQRVLVCALKGFRTFNAPNFGAKFPRIIHEMSDRHIEEHTVSRDSRNVTLIHHLIVALMALVRLM